ncbi:MAG: 50S ribosomal protein L22 [Magnetococcus sp. WYHC-3]
MQQEAISKTMNLQVSPLKARLVIDQIRGKRVDAALQILQFSNKRVSGPIQQTLRAAIANAENNLGYDVDTLVVSRAFVDQGVMMKRFRPRARGRASRILKRSSHITVAVRPSED